MQKHSISTKLGLRFTIAVLASSTILAAFCLSEAANAAPRRYYAAPEWNHREPFEFGDGDYGPYRERMLPNGTLTGPIADSANGG
jgi:hypothetical protein